MHLSDPKNQQNVYFRCVEDSNDAIMISDLKGVLVYVNPAWSKIYGYSREEAVGNTPRLLHSGLQPDDFYSDMWRQIQDPEVGHWKGELINRAKDGTLVPVLLSITPFRGPDEKISGYMGIAVDMTPLKKMQSQVAHSERLASIGILSSGLAHEIGTPLGVVRGRAEFLLSRLESTDAKRDLEVITHQIDRISNLIQTLLRISRTTSDVNLKSVDLHPIAHDVLDLVAQSLKEGKITLDAAIAPGFMVYADSNRLEQILLNLLMNAVQAIEKAQDDGRTAGHRLRLKAEKAENGRSYLHIEDTGCGIPAENFKHLFQPFFTTKDVGRGTGLGLAIVSQLLHEMNAEISVTSEVGKGTTFSITFPPAPEHRR